MLPPFAAVSWLQRAEGPQSRHPWLQTGPAVAHPWPAGNTLVPFGAWECPTLRPTILYSTVQQGAYQCSMEQYRLVQNGTSTRSEHTTMDVVQNALLWRIV